ncbi:alpha-amylase family glycosyl hydrolase [Sediminibacillus massiliensis]|uniref:alpha-amylase family glycosyl hydrolase n=1 Tax=Sediminibacillus massiliensis TaxID=1926277 RepID=UPI0015C39D5C|nr:alpha-amylase family glycosyl hydrolase [Sediminibacillus massiliensis]
MKKILTIMTILPFLVFCSQPAQAEEQEERTVEEETIYYLMVDRFVNQNFENDEEINIDDPEAYHGGDLEGVISQLDELKQQGFTAVNISPLMENAPGGYHGMWVTDFMELDEQFGTWESAQQLVEEAHSKNMKVYMDFTINHTAEQHPWTEDASKQGWFLPESEVSPDHPETIQASWVEGLPRLNLENPDVAASIKEAGLYWAERLNLDGYRLLLDSETPLSFVETFTESIRDQHAKFKFLADDMTENGGQDYKDAGIDLVLDYSYNDKLTAVLADVGNPLEDLPVQAAGASKGIFLDSQYTTRFTREAVKNEQNPVTRWKLGLLYLYTTPGTPVIYQGSEVAMDNGQDVPDHRTAQLNSGEDELKQYLEQIGSLREQYASLTKGDFEHVASDGAMSLYKRSYQQEEIFIAINNDNETKTIRLEGDRDGEQLRGLLYDNIVRLDDNNDYRITLDRETADVFIVEKNTGINWLFVSFILLVFAIFISSIIYLTIKQKRRTK